MDSSDSDLSKKSSIEIRIESEQEKSTSGPISGFRIIGAVKNGCVF